MSKLSRKDFTLLMNILSSIDKIKQYSINFSNADDFCNDTKSFDAAMMNFIVIGEMSHKLSDEFRYETDEIINWFKIIGLRNIIAHNYFGIDAEEVWQIIENTLLDFEVKLQKIIEEQ